MILMAIGVTGCAAEINDAAFCGPDFSGAIARLAEVLPDPNTPNKVGRAGTSLILAHDAGCAK